MESSANFYKVDIDRDELDNWNWGAFWLTFIWGTRHRVYVSFLALIPVVNLFVMFYLGLKGSQLAAKKCGWIDLDSYYKSVRSWNIAGWVFGIATIVATLLLTYDSYNQEVLEYNYRIEVTEMILESDEALLLIGSNFNITHYNVSNRFNFKDVTRSMLVASDNGEFFVLIRVDNNNDITELLISRSLDFGNKEIILIK